MSPVQDNVPVKPKVPMSSTHKQNLEHFSVGSPKQKDKDQPVFVIKQKDVKFSKTAAENLRGQNSSEEREPHPGVELNQRDEEFKFKNELKDALGSPFSQAPRDGSFKAAVEKEQRKSSNVGSPQTLTQTRVTRNNRDRSLRQSINGLIYNTGSS